MTVPESTDPIPVTVDRLVLDPRTEAPIVILKGKSGEEDVVLPIWIGPFEAFSIATAMGDEKPPRPMTHDLLQHVLERLGGRLERVVVRDIQEGTFFASLYVRRDTEEIEVDARPSDAIALAVRVKAPIFVTREVLSASVRSIDFLDESKEDAYREFLEGLDPKDFSKYKM